jgi:hypothetical protein
MPFEIVAYELLKSNVQESINTLIRSHGEDPNKLGQSLKKLPDERRIQATFLLKSINLLDASTLKSDEKARVLNAATYYVRDEIGLSYKWVSPENSIFFNSLTNSLVLNKDNQPDRNDLVDMYGPLEKFIRSQVYKSCDPRKGYLDEQPYAIKGYSVKEHIISIIKKLSDWKIEIVEAAEVKNQNELESKKHAPTKGFFSGMFSSATPVTPKGQETGRTLGNI